ncbi:alpha/beta fold hydrolase [Ancylobacter vacuolatus]|uniref:N-formylmaleamate deformylase n=1 Tax=Ancylobacter vacuolatus TaxID=223389 RepID=A0ABU0DE71_9HYPH|nr:alpha/beta hydrolase [Ancylobacter vacuolatus]MDQ0346711.1 N-formylmaleamate deformylase [Ancylobacter vacuolatus]
MRAAHLASVPHCRGAHCLANGIRLHYLDFNPDAAGAPILLLPGITSPAATWAFVAQPLAATRRVIVPDLRGRGLSESRAGLGYALEDYAQDALELVDGLGLRQPVILGHSMGARIAIRLAARSSGVVSRLVLVDPPLSGPGRAPYPTPLSSYLTAHEAASRGATVEAFRPLTPGWSDPQIALRLQWLPTCSVEAITRSHAGFHEEDIFPDLPFLDVPTLLVFALRAKVVSADAASEMVRRMPNGRAIGIDAGHMIPWDNLDDFLTAIAAFLDHG